MAPWFNKKKRKSADKRGGSSNNETKTNNDNNKKPSDLAHGHPSLFSSFEASEVETAEIWSYKDKDDKGRKHVLPLFYGNNPMILLHCVHRLNEVLTDS